MLLPWLTGLAAGIGFLHFVQKLVFPYFWDDFWYLLKVVRYGIRLEMYALKGELFTVLDKFLSLAKKQPQKPFIIYEGDIYTYQDVDKRSSRVAHVFLNHSTLKRGDTVALLMSNEPDFVHVWFGLAKLGCVVAFLNSNIVSNSLLHCIRSCEPRALVVGAGKKPVRVRSPWAKGNPACHRSLAPVGYNTSQLILRVCDEVCIVWLQNSFTVL